MNDSMPMYSSPIVLRIAGTLQAPQRSGKLPYILLDHILCQIWHSDKPPYKVSSRFALTLLRRQQLALVKPTTCVLLRIHSSRSSNFKIVNTSTCKLKAHKAHFKSDSTSVIQHRKVC